ncbi:MAG: rhamnulokinase [Prolixibacteraceae bacterium]|nr:rhamnulokinase [Prolixibacteraceae bacterium]MBN2773083.1 rhamnulokinase [Prolixibacteraceae bacterium]
MRKFYLLAIDLGASSGRAILGILTENKLELKEIHRFENRMQQINGSYYWDIFRLFNEIKIGFKKCISEYKIQPDSIGIDTWGVDYSLINKEGQIIGLPYAYRDHRTNGIMEEFFKLMPSDEVYRLSGLQFMQFNTLFQLYSSVREKQSQMKIAKSLLFMPDTLNYLFTGIKRNEYTIASTSQLLKPGQDKWEKKLFKVAGIPKKLVNDIIQPGNVLGKITNEISLELNSKQIPVVAVASHDTASAVVSVPAEDNDWVFISSGTWSIMGIECKNPIVNTDSLTMNFTNEGGVDGTTRFLKNIMGMWLIQECKRIWDQERKHEWSEIVEMSKIDNPFKSLIDPDNHSFLNPENMPEAIKEYCRRTNQPVPESKGEIARCIYVSLVLKYKYTFDQLERVSEKKINRIHIIGGGAHNREMNQMTANAIMVPVYAGPTEATSIGNIMCQACGLGLVGSLKEIRKIVKKSFKVVEYQPHNRNIWEEPYDRFLEHVNQSS